MKRFIHFSSMAFFVFAVIMMLIQAVSPKPSVSDMILWGVMAIISVIVHFFNYFNEK